MADAVAADADGIFDLYQSVLPRLPVPGRRGAADVEHGDADRPRQARRPWADHRPRPVPCDLQHLGDGVGGFERRNDAFKTAQQLESIQRFIIHDRHILDATRFL